MNRPETVKKLFTLIENKDTSAAAQLLTSDFVFSGPVPEPISGEEWLGMHDLLNVAFPDWSYNMTDLHQHGPDVHVTFQITGTQRGDLDLSSMGMPDIPATGKSIKLPKEESTIEFDGEKICAVKVKTTSGGGVSGILSQLGVAVPTS